MKTFLVSALCCLMGTAAMSQHLVLKPAIGINFNDFTKQPATGEYSSQVGWQIGGTVAIGDRFYFEPGIFYAEKSSKYSSGNPSVSDTKFDISGVRIPVGVGFKLFGAEAPINVRAMGGGSAFIVTSVSDGPKSDYSTPAWGLYAGAGVDVLMLFLDLKYEWSLTNVQKDVSQIDVGKSRTFYINLGFRLPM
jgi:hypothetical protein